MQRTVLCVGHIFIYDIGCLGGSERGLDGIVIFICKISLIKKWKNESKYGGNKSGC